MNTIAWLQSYVQELQDSIKALNFNRVVIDDGEVVKYLQDLRTSDNMILLGVIPEMTANSRDEDNFQLKGSHLLMILEKTSDSNMRYDDAMAMWERTYQAAEDVVRKLMTDKVEGDCATLRRLDPNSITIVPVWKKASTNGWLITFTMDKLV